MKRLILALAAALPAFAAAGAAEVPPPMLYARSASVTLPGGEPDWDYLRLDQRTGRLYIARHDDGLTVFDVNRQRAVGTVGNSVNANGPLVIPQFGRGYAAMTDGSVLVFDLRTLAPIRKLKLDTGGEMDAAVYDPASRRVYVTTGHRPAGSAWYILDAATGRLLGKRAFDSTKMDTPVADGKGWVYAPVRDRNVILKLRSSDLAEVGRFTLGACQQPSAVEYRSDADRLLIACRGDKPVFEALDPANGRVLAAIPIGHHVDGLVVDEARRRIVASSGDDAILTVIGYDGPDRYRLLGTVGTQPMARTMQIDKRTGRLFLVTADYTLPPAGAADGPPVEPYFHPGTFRVLTYTPR